MRHWSKAATAAHVLGFAKCVSSKNHGKGTRLCIPTLDSSTAQQDLVKHLAEACALPQTIHALPEDSQARDSAVAQPVVLLQELEVPLHLVPVELALCLNPPLVLP